MQSILKYIAAYTAAIMMFAVELWAIGSHVPMLRNPFQVILMTIALLISFYTSMMFKDWVYHYLAHDKRIRLRQPTVE